MKSLIFELSLTENENKTPQSLYMNLFIGQYTKQNKKFFRACLNPEHLGHPWSLKEECSTVRGQH